MTVFFPHVIHVKISHVTASVESLMSSVFSFVSCFW